MWEKGQQITPDTCMPMKVGDCMNHCPVQCAPGDMMCPGKMDSMGCKMPDTCHNGSKLLSPHYFLKLFVSYNIYFYFRILSSSL